MRSQPPTVKPRAVPSSPTRSPAGWPDPAAPTLESSPRSASWTTHAPASGPPPNAPDSAAGSYALFDEHIGLPPKTLHSIVRFQRLRAWLAASSPGLGTLARAAAECGYFDQAHLCRDCARLCGLTPATLHAGAATLSPSCML